MDVMEIIISAATLCGAYCLEKKKRRRRRWWIRPIYQRRYLQGDYNNLIQEMRLQDPEFFFNYTRMSVELFDKLLALVGPIIEKHSNRPSIPKGARLACTLRMLAAGDSLQTLAFSYRMSKSVVCIIVRETCDAIWKALSPMYLSKPNANKWTEIAKNFENEWNLPNCVGAIDGKHVAITAPYNSGSEYFNYKKYFSIVLFAVCDANYIFTYVDIGSFGSQSDGGIFGESQFGKLLQSGELDLPASSLLSGTNTEFPYYFIGDEAFPLQSNLLRPFPGKFLPIASRIYNYRLSRARRCIENAFGILAARWRIYHKTINAHPDTVDNFIKATVCLHNFIKINEDSGKYCGASYTDTENFQTGEIQPGEWRRFFDITKTALQPVSQIRRLGARNAKLNAVVLRNTLKDYLSSKEGSVAWQHNCI